MNTKTTSDSVLGSSVTNPSVSRRKTRGTIGGQLYLLSNFVSLVYSRFRQERCFQLCGSLTFTTLLALVPLVTIVLMFMTAFPVFNTLSEQLREFVLTNMVPEMGSKVISGYVEQFSRNAAKLTAAGVSVLVISSIMLMLTIDKAFNTIWRVKRPRPLVQRVLIYWSLLTAGPLLMGGSLTIWSWLVRLSNDASSVVPIVAIELLKVVPLALTALAFGLLYRLVPNRYVSVIDAAIGGVFAAIFFEAMKYGFGQYIANFASYKLVYGAFSSVPIFLIWVYASWVVVIFAAVITSGLSYWRTGGVKNPGPPGSLFVDALETIVLLARAHQTGEVLNLEQLRAFVKLPWEEMEFILDRLVAGGWVAKLQGNGWILARDADCIRAVEVLRSFVIHADAVNSTDDQAIRNLVGRIVKSSESVVNMTLADLAQLHAARSAATKAA
ncbi:MAG: YihY family inner membrane protein [Betaproteobacteria bacterium]|jgi:membrane protein|nr:MAG: YihY family inner membrane protein [Betaproteobacteria bacterium]